jgi:hypothetical protein
VTTTWRVPPEIYLVGCASRTDGRAGLELTPDETEGLLQILDHAVEQLDVSGAQLLGQLLDYLHDLPRNDEERLWVEVCRQAIEQGEDAGQLFAELVALIEDMRPPRRVRHLEQEAD